MIKVFYGEKGMGKSKLMVDLANEHAELKDGVVVFIDDSDDLMLKLKHVIRFTNVSVYPVSGSDQFFAFICGVISQNYDIESIFIDGLTYIIKEDINLQEKFFLNVSSLMEKYGIHFIFSINGRPEAMPPFLQAYV